MLEGILKEIREKRPLLHCMVNLVTANDCANLALACGASPIMAEDPEEAEQVAAASDGLVLNLGTPSPRKIKALLLAGKTAARLHKPVVFDPVGAGCSDFRREAARRILLEAAPDIIRGNAGEIKTLLDGSCTHRGVDTEERMTGEPAALAAALARQTGAVVVLSGETDIVSDGAKTYRVHNGHAMMRSVTGTGCQMSVYIGACAAANPHRLLAAALAGVCGYGLCGETAHAHLQAWEGNASYRSRIIDAAFHLSEEALLKGARYEIC